MRIFITTFILSLLSITGLAQEAPAKAAGKVIEFCATAPMLKYTSTLSPGSKLRQFRSLNEFIKIEFIIDTDGSIEHLQLISCPEGFRDTCVNWAKGFKFFPAIAGGQACKARAYVFLRTKPEHDQLQFSFGMTPKPIESDWLPVPES